MKIFKKIKFHSEKNSNQTLIKLEDDISYSEFWLMTIKLANYLYKNKYKNICILEGKNKSYLPYVAMVATLLSGGTYIPVNSSTPLKRLEFILTLSKSNILISTKKISNKIKIKTFTQKNLLKLKKIKNFNPKKSKKDAYIIFTSGSTGIPKGVKISRKSLDHYISWITKKFFNDKDIKCSQHPGIGFDLSIADIYGVMCSGGTLYPIKNAYDKLFLNKFIKINKLTHWLSVPSAIDLICNNDFLDKGDLISLKKMFFCGEVLKKLHLKKIFKVNKNIKVTNTYGPTEATVSCTEIELNSSNYKRYCQPNASIGKTIRNMNMGLINKNDNNEGELFICGPQISPGYLDNYKLNKKKFIKIGNKRVFLTGDICKIINNNYYFSHRADRQVKVNGNRIELDEIDNLIGEITNSISYSSIIKNNIITFFIGKYDNIKIIKKLSYFLPNYMLPKEIININKWPKNKNLKIDEQKLITNYLWKKN
jgi:D-alanine--poly(phosphoribitol) ligase subunit 1